MRDPDDLFAALETSTFRRSFHLGRKERDYVVSKGMPTVIDHARDFIWRRLAPAEPANDGKQTPFKGHPVFIAQHATATCCRSCLHKWHLIDPGRELTPAEQAHVVSTIERWLLNEMKEP